MVRHLEGIAVVTPQKILLFSYTLVVVAAVFAIFLSLLV